MEQACANPGCDQKFAPRFVCGKPQRFCTPVCRDGSAERAATRRRSATLVWITCEECGVRVEVSSRGTPRRYCGDKCKTKANNVRCRRAWLPLRNHNPDTKQCGHCGKAFLPKRRDRIYCYDSWCVQLAYAKRKRDGQGARVHAHAVACSGCGAVFEANRPEARWCSKLCANRHWGLVRSRQRGKPSEAKYTDLQIFERDGWRCHLCGSHVDRALQRTHPDGVTIDHLVPISHGGRDEPANVATAHWRCNRAKGVRPMNEQLALI